MNRRLLNLLTALSLLVCAMVCALWVRSHFAHDRLLYMPLTVNGTARASSYIEAGQTRGVVWLRAGRRVQPRADGDERDAVERDMAVSRHRDARRLGWWMRRPPEDFIPRDSGSRWQRMGFHAGADSDDNGRSRWWGADVTAPHWFLALLCAAPPAARLARARLRRRRRATGRCAACGYDLRATPDQCPECGAAGGVEQSQKKTRDLGLFP